MYVKILWQQLKPTMICRDMSGLCLFTLIWFSFMCHLYLCRFVQHVKTFDKQVDKCYYYELVMCQEARILVNYDMNLLGSKNKTKKQGYKATKKKRRRVLLADGPPKSGRWGLFFFFKISGAKMTLQTQTFRKNLDLFCKNFL